MHDSERTDFPLAGARARQWRRFEDGLHRWLDSPEGRFHLWDAQRRIEDYPKHAVVLNRLL